MHPNGPDQPTQEEWLEGHLQDILSYVTQGHPILESDQWDEIRQKTPERFLRALTELTHRVEFDFTTFKSDVDEMVVMRDISFTTLCAHHLFPFMGVAHVAYIPDGRVAGLSKLARTVRYYAKGLSLQETLTADVAARVEAELKPLGVGVVMEAEHLCYTIRGVQAPGTTTITSKMLGVFADHDRTAKAEFLQLIRGAQ